MQSGIVSQLAPLAPLIDGIEFGLLPTPTASQYGSNRSASSGAAVRPSLALLAKWPTPNARDWKDTTEKSSLAVLDRGGQMTLGRAVHKWPTPRAIDGRPKGNGPRQDTLTGAINYNDAGERIGSLNPTWVEWLMGFPIGWTDLEDSATPSSRKSRSSSAKPSSTA